MAPNDGRNNWCHSRVRDFDFKTFRDFFKLRDQKTSGAMAPVAPPSSAPLMISECVQNWTRRNCFHFCIKTMKSTYTHAWLCSNQISAKVDRNSQKMGGAREHQFYFCLPQKIDVTLKVPILYNY